ncbi:hypothetical protein C8J35_11039 [Rhizobium sp. PP-F2F-G38]|uniref:PepSY domain-containing protein n=1 Tax=Ferranicluibacter rubi TaxID=2715133 RepID=A0AA44CA87_9HYPH|nr:PepSY domain-containing protein [Ferranicluibacter rubi]NHT75588.1 PepSY domain-containing protein [Ferranicluibacter rubi]PYE30922.1 hypothetical protein C8J37_11445 [Rhizobium sp. PP-WC-1G-195]PYE94386.1 hypothetical protein C8J35_11039 [Rhizobium sp. PP-F2F-G38]TCQ18078.1 hypothetical protein C8J33_11138 [Rhizobium sp. PP-CC-3G-465]
MKKLFLATAILAVSAFGVNAQTTPAPSANGDTPAVATPDSGNSTAPVEGANSFTEAQAKERIEAAGYTELDGLMLDDKGIWQAKAMKDGKSAAVSMDYQGNIVSK